MKGDHSYPKQNRITSRDEFQDLYKTGKKFSSKYFHIFHKKASGPDGQSGLGISVPGRLGNAVFRNYHKRVLRGFFRKEMKGLAVSKRMLFVLRKKPENREALMEDLMKVAEWLKKTERSAG